jgi:hypothetical protein
MQSTISRVMQMCGAVLVLGPWSAAGAVTVHAGGYTYVPFVTTSQTTVGNIRLDDQGNLFLCQQGDVRKVSPDGVVSPWSSVAAGDVAFTSTGDGYAAGGSPGLFSLAADGSFANLHSDANAWTGVALGPDGTLYATTIALSGSGLWTVDRSTGTPTILVPGGPGPNGDGIYEVMTVGLDGKLYVTGTPDGSPGSWGVFRLDGALFTKVASWPHGGFGLAQDNQSIFYTAVNGTNPSGQSVHEVWMADPATGVSTLVADGPGIPVRVAYDRARNRLYVGGNSGTVYYLAKSATPTLKETWSALKAKFH